jgi:type IV pilus assembly protein PilA
MISRMMGELSARRNSLKEKEKGFTLIELLVVIVIIGILAAIAIPVYLNVQNNAKDTAAKSDLANAKTAVVAYEADKTVLPGVTPDTTTLTTNSITSTPPGLGGYGFTLSNAGGATPETIAYAGTNTAPAFCLVATSITSKQFWVTDSSGVVNVKPSNC